MQESSGFVFNCLARSLPRHESEKWEPGDKTEIKLLRRNSAAPVPGLSLQGCCHKPQLKGWLLGLSATLQRVLALHRIKEPRFSMALSSPPKNQNLMRVDFKLF